MTDPVGLAAVREWVGFTAPPDTTINGLLTGGLTPNRAALSILRARLADFTGTPDVEVPDDATVKYDRANLVRAITIQIAKLEDLVAAETQGDPNPMFVVQTGSIRRGGIPIR